MMTKRYIICFAFLLYPYFAYSQVSEETQTLDDLMKKAAEAEKVEDCETAYNLYNAALGEVELLDEEKYKNKIKELRSIITTKLYKLESCFKACNPSERQKMLFERAKSLSEEGQRKRMIQILRRMLVGKNEKCAFWRKVRSFLNTIPGEENINENADPCEVSEELKGEVNKAREEVRKLKNEIVQFTNIKKGEFIKKADPLIDFFRRVEDIRIKMFQLREEYIDCDEVYKSLAEDSNELRSMYEQTRDIIISGYKGVISDMASRIAGLRRQLRLKDEELNQVKDEFIKLKSKFDELSQFNEQIFNDLFALANIESIRPSAEIQGKEMSSIFENIGEVVSDEKKVMELLKQKYPEYFQDGVNIEALKRRKFVVEKITQILSRFKDSPHGQTIGFSRTLDELNATSKMMDSIIKTAKVKEESSRKKDVFEQKSLIFLVIALFFVGIGAIVSGIVIMKRKKESV